MTPPGAAPASPRPFSDLPGPRGLPLVGSTFSIRPDAAHQQFRDWARRHGPLYRVRVGLRDYLVSSDPDTSARILRDRPDAFGRPVRLEMIARESGTLGLFAVNGGEWKRQRPLVMSGFDPAHVKRYVPTLVDVTLRLLKRWRRLAGEGRRLDLLHELRLYAMDVSTGLAFGVDLNTIESTEETLQAHLRDIFRMTQKRLFAIVPYWHWIRFPEDRRLEASYEIVHAAIRGFIARAAAELNAHPERRLRPANLLEALVAARDMPGSGFSDRDVHGNVMTLLLAGEDTTANTLAWTLLLLHRHPDAARRVREDVDRILGGREVASDAEQLAALDSLEACASESMRLHPVAPLIALEARRDTVVGGYAVPAGTLVMLETRSAAMDAAHFERPGEFLPERWRPAAASPAHRAAMPFGAGPRICPGRYLALVEMKMLLAMLLRNFEIADVTGRGGSPVRERMAFTMGPATLEATLRPR